MVASMRSSAEMFSDEIEGFLARFQINATSFGRGAMSDPSFVFDIRAGRSPNLRTIDRVRKWMDKTADPKLNYHGTGGSRGNSAA